MDRFAALQAFVSVVDAGGFAAAARDKGVSRSSMNRLVIQLEDRLGVQLLNRTTRRVAPTGSGLAFYDRAKAILADLDAAEQALTGAEGGELAGRFRINAPMSFGTMHLGPAVADFLADHPQLEIDLHLNDRQVDILEDGFDLALRIAQPEEDSSMVDLRICTVNRVVCAAPAYLATRQIPVRPGDLRDHRVLHYGHQSSGLAWRLGGRTVRVRPSMTSNNGEVLRDAAVRGTGICLLPTFIVGADIQAGRLTTLLADHAPGSLMLAAVYPAARHLSPVLRRFTDFISERFGRTPYWDPAT